MNAYTIRFAMQFTLVRILTGLTLYVVGLAFVWPPSFGEALPIAIGSVLIVAALTGLEVDRQ